MFGGSRWSFSWLCQKVNIAIAGVALSGGSALGGISSTAVLFRLGDFGD